MNLLDENIAASQRVLLRKAGIAFRQIGYEEARKGIQDDEIISFLVQSRRVTFFTRDDDFYQKRFCHAHYCLVLLDVPGLQVAEFARKFLRHSAFRTQAQRMGTVVRVSHEAIHLWRLRAEAEEIVPW